MAVSYLFYSVILEKMSSSGGSHVPSLSLRATKVDLASDILLGKEQAPSPEPDESRRERRPPTSLHPNVPNLSNVSNVPQQVPTPPSSVGLQPPYHYESPHSHSTSAPSYHVHFWPLRPIRPANMGNVLRLFFSHWYRSATTTGRWGS